MKKSIALMLCVILVSGCSKDRSAKFTFSHVSLTSCVWQCDTDPATKDNRWHLSIHSYIRIDSSGAFQLARRIGIFEPTHYFQGIVPATADSLLSTLSTITEDSSYVEKGLKHIDIYDGTIQCLVVEKSDRSPVIVEYVYVLYPEGFQEVLKYLESFSEHDGKIQSEPFDFKPATDVIVPFDNRRIFHFPDSVMTSHHIFVD